MITPEECSTVETAWPRYTHLCIRKACDHFAQVKGGNCPCCFSRKMIEPYPRPEVVVLCGSTRFFDEFQRANYELTMQGKIVLSVGFYPHQAASHAFKPGGTGCCAICDDLPGQGEHAKTAHGEGVGHDSTEKIALDALHKRKIDIADRVLVLNVGGYIGDSTRSEIEYAEWYEKPIDYLEPV